MDGPPKDSKHCLQEMSLSAKMRGLSGYGVPGRQLYATYVTSADFPVGKEEEKLSPTKDNVPSYG